MTIGIVDISLLVIVLLFVASGLYYGFIHTFGNLVGMIIGILASGYLMLWLNTQLQIFAQPVLAVIVFLMLIVLISRLIGWLVDLIDRLYKIVSIIPFLSSINKLLGGLFGFIEGMVVIASIIYFTTTFMPESALTAQVLLSPTMGWLSWTLDAVAWLFPRVMAIV